MLQKADSLRVISPMKAETLEARSQTFAQVTCRHDVLEKNCSYGLCYYLKYVL